MGSLAEVSAHVPIVSILHTLLEQPVRSVSFLCLFSVSQEHKSAKKESKSDAKMQGRPKAKREQTDTYPSLLVSLAFLRSELSTHFAPNDVRTLLGNFTVVLEFTYSLLPIISFSHSRYTFHSLLTNIVSTISSTLNKCRNITSP